MLPKARANLRTLMVLPRTIFSSLTIDTSLIDNFFGVELHLSQRTSLFFVHESSKTKESRRFSREARSVA